VAAQLIGTIKCRQNRNGDEASVALTEFGLLPDIAKQDLVAQFSKLRDNFIRSFLRHQVILSIGVNFGEELPATEPAGQAMPKFVVSLALRLALSEGRVRNVLTVDQDVLLLRPH
jgi:hypothetical protein